jgi:23S rRNA (uridine2552-2'-O)-methyltransferase
MEIQEKYRVIRRSDSVLDIGAAPGGWSLFILETIGGSGRVVGVDTGEVTGRLSSVKGGRFSFIKGNIHDDAVFRSIAELGPYSLIVSDAAPSTTGDRIVDTSRSMDIARRVLEISEKTLSVSGRLVIKIFQGGDEAEISASLAASFASVKIFKPKASKKASMEIYCIGLDHRGKAVRG